MPAGNEALVNGAEEALKAAPVDLVVYIDSLGVSMLGRFSLVRVFREEWRSKVAFYRSKEGGSFTLDQAIKQATHKVDEQRAAEVFERMLTRSAEVIDFEDLQWTVDVLTRRSRIRLARDEARGSTRVHVWAPGGDRL